MKYNIFIAFLFLLASLISFSQEVVSTAGETQQAENIELSWTIGEPVIQTLTSGAHTLTQGFHQTKLTITALDNMTLSGTEVNIFPNPTSDFITIKFEKVPEDIYFSLYNTTGSLLKQQKVLSSSTQINFTNYASGSYILKLFQKKSPIQQFKVIKR